MSNLYYFLKRMENESSTTTITTTTTTTTTTIAPLPTYDVNCGQYYSDPVNTTYTVFLGTGTGEVVIMAYSCTVNYWYNGVHKTGHQFIDSFIASSSEQAIRFSKIAGVDWVEINVYLGGDPYYRVIVNCPTTLRVENCGTRVTGNITETIAINLGSGTGKVYFYPNETQGHIPHCMLEYNDKIVCYSESHAAEHSVLSFDKVNQEPEQVYVTMFRTDINPNWDFVVSCPTLEQHTYSVGCGVQYTLGYWTQIDSTYSPYYREELWKPRGFSELLLPGSGVLSKLRYTSFAISSGTHFILKDASDTIIIDVIGPAYLRGQNSAPGIYDSEFHQHIPEWSFASYPTSLDPYSNYYYTITCDNPPSIKPANVGFYLGGYVTSTGQSQSTITMLNLRTGVTVQMMATLSQRKYFMSGINALPYSKSYVAGGNIEEGYIKSSLIEVLNASTITTDVILRVLSDTLNKPKFQVAGLYSRTEGYFLGGSSTVFYGNLNVLNFSTESVSNVGLGATLQVLVNAMSCASSDTFGYVIGGTGENGAPISYIQKLNFFTLLTHTDVVSSLSTPKYYTSSAHSKFKAYVVGGKSTSQTESTLETIDFANDSVQMQVTGTSLARYRCATTFSEYVMYIAGGIDANGGDRNEVEDIAYATTTIFTYSKVYGATIHYGSSIAGVSCSI